MVILMGDDRFKNVDRYVCIELRDVEKSIERISKRKQNEYFSEEYNKGAVAAFQWILTFGKVRNIDMGE